MNDTIAAISTALGVGAISIIRISGKDSMSIVNKIFKGKDLTKVQSHTINYGYICNGDEIIDEVLVSVMKSPKTFTRENIVEINCHGGIATTNKILELVLTSGARLAEPGEFTKRAFLNGRIDLIEAEGIMNLISSKTESARKAAINQLNGKATKLVKDIRNKLIKIISNIEVNIDYPEYEDIEVLTTNKILPEINEIKSLLTQTIKESQNSRFINEGIAVALVGSPNVGKSSLLNSLIEQEKAIVTDIPGTTRDVVEGSISLNGVIVNFYDTAGIRDTNNLAEKIGIKKSNEILEKADLIIFILNNSTPLSDDEIELYNKIKRKKHIIVLNKIDLDTKIDLSEIKEEIIKISLLNSDATLIKDKIISMFNLESIETKDLTYLSGANDIAMLKKSLENINEAIRNIDIGAPIDIVEIELKEAWTNLGIIIGEGYSEELLDELFQRFCLGK